MIVRAIKANEAGNVTVEQARNTFGYAGKDIVAVFTDDGVTPTEIELKDSANTILRSNGYAAQEDIGAVAEQMQVMFDEQTTQPVELPAALLAEAMPELAGTRIVAFMASNATAADAAPVQAVVLDKFGVQADTSTDAKPFAVGEYVGVGAVRTYGDVNYEVVQAHVTQGDWPPPLVPALWKKAASGGIEEWKQPDGAHNAYAKGTKVKHKGFVWVSDVNANVWEPGVYGWTKEGAA